MDQVKEAFQKVKQDMDSIKEELSSLKFFLNEHKEQTINLEKEINQLSTVLSSCQEGTPTHKPNYPVKSYFNPANNTSFKPHGGSNSPSSTGNGGVPADRQTNQQTNQQMQESTFDSAIKVLSNIEDIKKEIRTKFKHITDQEFLVFSTIYQLSEEKIIVNYKTIAIKLGLTESSIRDYVGKLIKKDLPIQKTKVNNKTILLSISPNFQKVISLPILLQLKQI